MARDGLAAQAVDRLAGVEAVAGHDLGAEAQAVDANEARVVAPRRPGGQRDVEALRVAPDYPKTWYVTTSGNSTAKHVAGMTFAFEEASYLAGLVAGAMTKSGVVGVIGGTELPPVKASFAAFEAGAAIEAEDDQISGPFLGGGEDLLLELPFAQQEQFGSEPRDRVLARCGQDDLALPPEHVENLRRRCNGRRLRPSRARWESYPPPAETFCE